MLTSMCLSTGFEDAGADGLISVTFELNFIAGFAIGFGLFVVASIIEAIADKRSASHSHGHEAKH